VFNACSDKKWSRCHPGHHLDLRSTPVGSGAVLRAGNTVPDTPRIPTVTSHSHADPNANGFARFRPTLIPLGSAPLALTIWRVTLGGPGSRNCRISLCDEENGDPLAIKTDVHDINWWMIGNCSSASYRWPFDLNQIYNGLFGGPSFCQRSWVLSHSVALVVQPEYGLLFLHQFPQRPLQRLTMDKRTGCLGLLGK